MNNFDNNGMRLIGNNIETISYFNNYNKQLYK